MKIFATFFSILLLAVSLPAQVNNQEFRATWVITWEYINSSSSVDANKARIRKILDDHKKANMTSVLWQVRQAGTAYYNSSYEPWGSYAGGTYPGFDPLQYALEEAHKRGLELHAWFNVFANASLANGTPAQQHPEWICRDQNGTPMQSNYALSPGLEPVRNYLKNVAMEVVRNYDIDGLHFDYVRWNEYSSIMPPEGFEKYRDEKQSLLDGDIPEELENHLGTESAGRYLYDVEHPYSAGVPSGFNSWEDWWRWSVTQFVKDMHDSVQAVKPWVRLSAAALGKYNWTSWQAYGVVYQDAALWFNEGYIDQLTPMHYHWTTGSGFYGMLQGSCPQCWGQYIQPGVNTGRLYTVGPGSYILASQNVWNNHPQIIESSRTVNWVDGFQFFSYGTWRDYEYWETAGKTFFKRKTKIRDTQIISDSIPDAPAAAIVKIDSLNYEVTVTPPASAADNHWYALYRSEDAAVNVNSDEIIEIKFGTAPFTVSESFTGMQDFNGKYYYAATTLNRYWNESLISNTVSTDQIPSYAPTVISTIPAEGDTAVETSVNVKFTFSKTMDPASFTDAVEFNPAAVINNLLFSTDNKTLTVQTQNNLSFSTDYTVTINASAKDINGKSIDGNGDGIPGDPFILNFSTVEEDNTGPAVFAYYPSGDSLTDIEDVFTFVFDELVDPLTINHNSVVFKKGSDAIAKDIHLRSQGNRSILSFKTPQPLSNNFNYSVTLTTAIKDVYGNPVPEDLVFNFITSSNEYITKTIIDDFSSEGFWEQPSYSGSTTGIIDSGTAFGYSANYFLPASSPAKGAYIQYQWNTSSSNHLLREYLSSGPPRAVEFDTSFIVQAYIFGDGSGNRFRFCLDEAMGNEWPNHEVSRWYAIDWQGWKLIEWDLADPSQTGNWIGNGILDGTKYRTDSFQMTYVPGASAYGRIYIDNYRIVKKSEIILSIDDKKVQLPSGFALHQNYPNPFNPRTIIPFDLTERGVVNLEIYDILGRKIETLINEEMAPGHYEIEFDASRLSSGKYIYRLYFGDEQVSKFMIFMK